MKPFYGDGFSSFIVDYHFSVTLYEYNIISKKTFNTERNHIYNFFFRSASNITFQIQQWLKIFFNRVSELVVFNYLALYYITETIILTFTPSFLRIEKCLKDKVVLITGGAGGIGRELVLRIAKQGAKVIVWDKNETGKYFLNKNNGETVSCLKENFLTSSTRVSWRFLCLA